MLNRQDIITRLSKKRYTKKDAEIVLDDVIQVIMEALIEGEGVHLYGFGTFTVKQVAERSTIDLRSKKRIVIPSYKAPKFTPGKLLKRAIKEGIIRE